MSDRLTRQDAPTKWARRLSKQSRATASAKGPRMPGKPNNPTTDFWPRVQKTDDHWVWPSAVPRCTYGQMLVNGKTWYTHRLAWTLTYGPIPEGMHVLHRCDYPPCCNPAHLFLGSQSDNMEDMRDKGRGVARLTFAQAEDIRCLYAAGASQKELALMFATTRQNIRLVLIHRTWRRPSRLSAREPRNLDDRSI